jgi:hypothetical protein
LKSFCLLQIVHLLGNPSETSLFEPCLNIIVRVAEGGGVGLDVCVAANVVNAIVPLLEVTQVPEGGR